MQISDILAMIFALWPLFMIAPLTWKRGSLIGNMLIMWVMLAIVRMVLAFGFPTAPLVEILVPEPLSTDIFYSTGGVLAILYLVNNFFKKMRLRSATRDTDSLLNLSPNEFEELVASIYRSRGHKVKVIGRQGDHGIDLIVNAKNGERWLVQCKRYKGKVGEPAVRDLYGTMHHENADRAAIVTSGVFTPQAKAWARGKPIHLYDGKQLVKLAKQRKKK